MLVGLAHLDGAAHGQIQVRSSLLLKVRRLQIAHQQRHHKVRLDLLDVLDGLTELVDAERDELFAHHGSAVFLDDFAHPLCRDLAEVVVRSNRVHALAVFFHQPWNQGRELLLRNRAGHKDVGVADAAFVLVVIEIQLLGLVHDRTNGFA